jgi:hypothetical protein
MHILNFNIYIYIYIIRPEFPIKWGHVSYRQLSAITLLKKRIIPFVFLQKRKFQKKKWHEFLFLFFKKPKSLILPFSFPVRASHCPSRHIPSPTCYPPRHSHSLSIVNNTYMHACMHTYTHTHTSNDQYCCRRVALCECVMAWQYGRVQILTCCLLVEKENGKVNRAPLKNVLRKRASLFLLLLLI